MRHASLNVGSVSNGIPRLVKAPERSCDDGAAALMSIGTITHRSAKDSIFWEGDAADHVYQIVRGTVCLYKLLPDGRRQVARFCHGGDLIGLTVDDAYPYTAHALTPVRLIRIRRVDLDARMETDRALRARVLGAIGEELSLAQSQLLLLGRKSASERVSSFLLAMREQSLREGGDGRHLSLPMTRVDIADFLGLTHETVCRILGSFRSQGVVSIPDPHHVVIRDPDFLEEVACGDAQERLCA